MKVLKPEYPQNEIVFYKTWFIKNQRKVLWFANNWFGRRVLKIHGNRSDVGKRKIVNITPNSISWFGGFSDKGEVLWQSEFRTNDKFARRLYYAFRPVWYLFHAWDLLIANNLKPAWNLGFDTATFYPNANTETTSVDGYVQNTNVVFATCRGASAGDFSQDSSTVEYLAQCGTGYSIIRGFFLFDTSSLNDAAVVSAAIISFCAANQGTTNTNSTTVDVVASTPASNTALVLGDFDQVGSTVFGSINISSWVDTDGTYNDITLDANGRAAVTATGVTKYGTRIGRDTANSAPTGDNYTICYFAEQTGTSKDPKLVLTYTANTAWTKDLDETVTLVATLSNQPGKIFSEVVTLADSIFRTTAKTLSDVVTLVDSLVRTDGRFFDEAVALADELISGKVMVLTIPVEVIAISDTLAKEANKFLADTIVLVDTSAIVLGRVLSDVVTLVATFNVDYRIVLSDVIELVDSVIRLPGKIFVETITLVISLAFFKRFRGWIMGKNKDTNAIVGKRL